MTEVDFWFLFGATLLSAAVIGWVCFLEVSYRLHRQRYRALIGLPGLDTEGEARKIVRQHPTAMDHPRERLRLADPKGKPKIAHAWPLVTSLNVHQAPETERIQTTRRFCA
jgi:hypothetical protein